MCSLICDPMDGACFGIEESEFLLPAHVGCRCVWGMLEELENV